MTTPLQSNRNGSGLALPGMAQGSNVTNTQGALTANSRHPALPFANTLPAAGQPGATITIPVSGTNFYLFSTTGTVLIQPTGGSAIPYVQGTGLDLSNEGGFTSLQISNPNSSPITFLLIIGTDQFIDKRVIITGGSGILFVQNAPTKNFGRAVATLGATSSIDFPGTSNGTTARKQIIIANIDGGGGTNNFVMHVRDSSSNTIGIVFAGSSWTAETSDDVKLFNPNGSGVSYNVGEIYYAS